jgi:hypothetical protein
MAVLFSAANKILPWQGAGCGDRQVIDAMDSKDEFTKAPQITGRDRA